MRRTFFLLHELRVTAGMSGLDREGGEVTFAIETLRTTDDGFDPCHVIKGSIHRVGRTFRHKENMMRHHRVFVKLKQYQSIPLRNHIKSPQKWYSPKQHTQHSPLDPLIPPRINWAYKEAQTDPSLRFSHLFVPLLQHQDSESGVQVYSATQDTIVSQTTTVSTIDQFALKFTERTNEKRQNLKVR